MRILVCGGRDYGKTETDEGWIVNQEEVDLLYRTLASIVKEVRSEKISTPITIIHGNARGADSLASDFVKRCKLSKAEVFQNVEEKAYPANWAKYGRAAGVYRNTQMLEEGEPDIVVAFRGGNGTANMVKQARACAVEVREIENG